MSTYNQAQVEVKFGDWISEGFRMFIEQWQAWVLQALVMIAVLLVLMGIEFVGFFAVAAVLGAALGDSSAVLIIALLPAFLTISMIAGSGLVCGMFKSAFKQLQGGTVELADLFSGMDRFLPVVLAQLCIAVMTMVGLLFCVVPAFIVAGLFYFTLPLIIHRNLGVADAMRTSFELAKKNILMFTLFALVVGILAQVGSYACYVRIASHFSSAVHDWSSRLPGLLWRPGRADVRATAGKPRELCDPAARLCCSSNGLASKRGPAPRGAMPVLPDTCAAGSPVLPFLWCRGELGPTAYR
jgi:hypothetical protein